MINDSASVPQPEQIVQLELLMKGIRLVSRVNLPAASPRGLCVVPPDRRGLRKCKRE